MPYCLYLRKSRADLDAEARGERETLARHERTLLNLAKRLSLNVTEIYREVVSGETIEARPVMQRLLSEVEQGVWDGVLVMEVERLARGDTIDQGLVAQAFKYSNTRIITPAKTYDPHNEFDEEYFEFGLFMSRREYKTIRRRLEAGRTSAINEGKWVFSLIPYGYERVHAPNGKGYTLAIKEDEAKIVRFIYDIYNGSVLMSDGSFKRVGFQQIATILDDMLIPPPNFSPGEKYNTWSRATPGYILENPVYAGYIREAKARTSKEVVDNRVVRKYHKIPRKDQRIVKGIHPGIVSEETFWKTQERIDDRPPTIPKDRPLKNPLAGLLFCKDCGRALVYIKNAKTHYSYQCLTNNCRNIGSYATIVFDRLLEILQSWADGFFDSALDNGQIQDELAQKEKELEQSQLALQSANEQLERTYELLEHGIYDSDTFIHRSQILSDTITAQKEKVQVLSAEIDRLSSNLSNYSSIAQRAQNAIDVFNSDAPALDKNAAFKAVIERIEYLKTQKSPVGGPYDNFELTVYPKIFKVPK